MTSFGATTPIGFGFELLVAKAMFRFAKRVGIPSVGRLNVRMIVRYLFATRRFVCVDGVSLVGQLPIFGWEASSPIGSYGVVFIKRSANSNFQGDVVYALVYVYQVVGAFWWHTFQRLATTVAGVE